MKILRFDISYRTSTNVKPWYTRIRCLVLFDYGWFDKICERIKCLTSEKM